MQGDDFVAGLFDFLQRSPTPFHAVKVMVEILEHAGFIRLTEKEQWNIEGKESGQGYFVTRNDSSIIAFVLEESLLEHGIHMVGAHTDSPCLKVKPNPEIQCNGYLQLGVEVYGGALLNPWFDRDLSLAGRVSYLNANDKVAHILVDWKKAIAVIPSLAIHLDREANDKRMINKQEHLAPIIMKLSAIDQSFHTLLLQLVNGEIALQQANAVKAKQVLDYELSFYDVQPPSLVGLHDDFIACARLDNLLSCYTGLMALIDGESKGNRLLVCNDHEEVGSVSAAGAQGNFLHSVLERFLDDRTQLARVMASSFMISVDNAHAIHPNFPSKHDAHHGPVINEGPVIKINANQRYASNSETSALFKYWSALADVPVQSFVVRSDMACGSTIGPITANQLGVRTVDVGVPSFAMHSIRELAGHWDAFYLYRVLRKYLGKPPL